MPLARAYLIVAIAFGWSEERDGQLFWRIWVMARNDERSF